jgi:hypothetical protein
MEWQARKTTVRALSSAERGALFDPDFVLAIQPLGDHGTIVKLDRSAILADDHQHVDRSVAR